MAALYRVYLRHLKTGKIKRESILAKNDADAKRKAESIQKNYKAISVELVMP